MTTYADLKKTTYRSVIYNDDLNMIVTLIINNDSDKELITTSPISSI